MAEMHWMVTDGNLETEGKKSSFSGPVAFLTQAGRHLSLYSCVKWPYPILILHFTPSRGKPLGDSLVLLTRGTHF